ncbi:MAG TPA: M48 family metallopeptidase [Cyclobacteriaceae bacterium]|nr:M48 family metallopeptidase [Cyclobacteriaceae bacterium]
MKKIVFQFLVLVVLFLGMWYGLSQIKYVDADELEQFSRKSERKLSELILDALQNRDKELQSDSIVALIDSIGRRICTANAIEYDSIRVHLILNSDINAFALPDRHMVIYTGLISQTNNPEELAGVMAHEIGHMEKNHVMKKLGKEVGLSMLIALMDGGNHFEIVRQMTQMLSSSAFSRTHESEADEFAMQAMAKADIDPENLANFLFRFSNKSKVPAELVWISTHPNGKDRAAGIMTEKKKLNYTPRPILHTSWDKAKKWVSEIPED